jgi:hypothetical protein
MKINEESPKGWRGTIRAMLTHHSEKFSKAACDDDYDGDKMCPYAIAHSMKDKGAKAHYKNQKSSLKGTPKKKKEFKGEKMSENKSKWRQWVEAREANEPKRCTCACEGCKNGDCKNCSCEDCSCVGCECC